MRSTHVHQAEIQHSEGGKKRQKKTAVLDRFEKIGVQVNVEKDIGDILDECDQEGIPKTNQIESIIWSHHHFDHTGNPQKFPKTTSLIVGPGFKKGVLPGYPKDEKSPINSDLWEVNLRANSKY